MVVYIGRNGFVFQMHKFLLGNNYIEVPFSGFFLHLFMQLLKIKKKCQGVLLTNCMRLVRYMLFYCNFCVISLPKATTFFSGGKKQELASVFPYFLAYFLHTYSWLSVLVSQTFSFNFKISENPKNLHFLKNKNIWDGIKEYSFAFFFFTFWMLHELKMLIFLFFKSRILIYCFLFLCNGHTSIDFFVYYAFNSFAFLLIFKLKVMCIQLYILDILTIAVDIY